MKKLVAGLVFAVGALFSTASHAQDLTDEQTSEAITFAQNAAAYVLYHEVGHMFVSQFELPILGREEDAADNIATLMLLHAETEEKDNVLLDAAHSWFLSNNSATDDVISDAEFYDSHSLDIQRAFQIVCLMVGADPDLFAKVASEIGIDEDRQESCAFDYEQLSGNWIRLSDAFVKQGNAGQRITVEYEPSDEEFEYAAEIFKDAQMLEAVSQEIMETFELPRAVKFVGRSCEEPNAYFDPEASEVIMCYELTAMFLDLIVEDILANPEG